MASSVRPVLLFYCQHSLGIGHLTRSFALASALSAAFRVVFMNGGRLPPGVPVPAGIELIDLPPLGMDDGHTVVSRYASTDVAAARAARRELLLATVARRRPAIVLVELFPFGRKKFAAEILPMVRAARALSPYPARIVCSLRDILVDARPDQQHHDNRAGWLAERYFDAVIIHSDPSFARIEASFRPRRALRTPVLYSGFVIPARTPTARPARANHLLASAGGGSVGGELLRATLRAWKNKLDIAPLRIIGGPFLPESQWCALAEEASGLRAVELLRHVPDMVGEMQRARASISQCGYNTALDIVVANVPALVVPYETATENEQRRRAERMARLGVAMAGDANALAPAKLAASLEELLHFRPRRADILLDGAARSTALIEQLYARPRVHRASGSACAALR